MAAGGYVVPRVREIEGHDNYPEYRCDNEDAPGGRCEHDSEYVVEGTLSVGRALFCEDHARAFVHREALERIAYPDRHPEHVKKQADLFLVWAESVAANALSFGSLSYVPAEREE